jgi:hypothetical protein
MGAVGSTVAVVNVAGVRRSLREPGVVRSEVDRRVDVSKRYMEDTLTPRL